MNKQRMGRPWTKGDFDELRGDWQAKVSALDQIARAVGLNYSDVTDAKIVKAVQALNPRRLVNNRS